MSKGRNTRQARLGDTSRAPAPFPITRRIGARQLEIQVESTAKGERTLEIQDIARCKIAHVATDQEISKKKNSCCKPGPTKRKSRARKQQETTKLSPTAQPFINTALRQSRDINTASVPEPTQRREQGRGRGTQVYHHQRQPTWALQADLKGNERRQHGYLNKIYDP